MSLPTTVVSLHAGRVAAVMYFGLDVQDDGCAKKHELAMLSVEGADQLVVGHTPVSGDAYWWM